MMGRISLRKTRQHDTTEWSHTYHGTIVTLNPTKAQTLRLVMVLTDISTNAVNVRPILEWTALIWRIDQETYTKKNAYAR